MKLKLYEVEVEYDLNYKTYEEKDTNYIEHTFIDGYLTGFEIVKENDLNEESKSLLTLKSLELEVYLLKRMNEIADNDYLVDSDCLTYNYSEVIELIGYEDKDGFVFIIKELEDYNGII